VGVTQGEASESPEFGVADANSVDDDADAKMILTAPPQRTGRDHQGVPVSRG